MQYGLAAACRLATCHPCRAYRRLPPTHETPKITASHGDHRFPRRVLANSSEVSANLRDFLGTIPGYWKFQ